MGFLDLLLGFLDNVLFRPKKTLTKKTSTKKDKNILLSSLVASVVRAQGDMFKGGGSPIPGPPTLIKKKTKKEEKLQKYMGV